MEEYEVLKNHKINKAVSLQKTKRSSFRGPGGLLLEDQEVFS